MKRHNLHTHTDESDGGLSPEGLVQAAEKTSLKILGITDHAFSTKQLPNQITDRLSQYLEHLRKIQSLSSNIDVRIGMEIDASMNYARLPPSQLPLDVLNKFDYVLFEYVNTEFDYGRRVGSRDISEIAKIRDKLKIPVGLAHNDLQRNFEGKEKYIAKTLAESDIFVELCQSEYMTHCQAGRNTRNDKDYYQYLSRKLIDELVRNGVKVVAGSDSHNPASLDVLNEVYQFIKENNLQYHEMVL